jgi:hypothetical protein
MNYLVIYPGRFHPFHLGHKASYDYLVNKYGADAVYIATSDKQAPVTSPFSYSDKVEMMTKLGVPASHIVKVKNPYQATEITDNLSPEQKADTALIFAVSAKDAERFNFNPKRNGSPSYIQPLPEYPGQSQSQKRLKPMTKAAYIDITPTVNFKVRGQDANSATVVRQLFIDGNDADRDQIITDLYGAPDSSLRDMFKQRLGITDHVVKMMQECRRIGTARSMALMERIIRAEREVLRESELGLNELALGAGLPAQPVASGKPDEAQWIIQTRANEYLVKFSFDPEPQEDEYNDYDDYEMAYKNSGMNTAFYARDKNGQWTMDITNVGEKELTQIIATVARLLAEFLKQHKHLTHIGIGGRDQRRDQLYQRLIQQNLQRYFPGQEFAIDQGGIRRVISEFAPTEPGGNDDGDVPPDIYTLANRWWNNTDDQDRIAAVLRSRGWDIQQSDGEEDVCQLTYRDGSVYYLNDGEFDPDLYETADYIEEKWSQKYKRSINCAHPRGFSQRAHCAGRKK